MTREEALQAIKEKIAYYERDKRLKGAIETLIPELKESEDDRIKKTITDSVFYQYGAGVEYKDVLDYLDKLEKQKEQKEIPLMNGDADLYFDNWFQQMGQVTSRQCFEEGIKYAQRLSKEQKPFNVCEQCPYYKDCPDYNEQKPSINIDQLKSLMLQYLQEAANEKDDSAIEADTDKWARKILGYDFEQKPVEWKPTKEQMVALNWAADGMLDNRSLVAGDIKAGLRSLYNDLQTKSIQTVEWSEEDRDMLLSAIEYVQTYPAHRQSVVNWLKSLPQRFNLQPKQEWSDNFEDNIRTLLHDKLTWHSEDGSMSSTVFIDDKTLKDIISGIWFYVGKEALKYPNKELNVPEWSEEDNKMINYIDCILDENEESTKSSDGMTNMMRQQCLNDISKARKWLKSLLPQQKKELNFSGFVGKIGSWFANLTLDRYRQTFDGDVYPATLLVQKYDSFVSKLSEEYNEKALHWKPSEAQMDALRASNSYWRGTTNEVPKISELESLYNELKKLGEKE